MAATVDTVPGWLLPLALGVLAVVFAYRIVREVAYWQVVVRWRRKAQADHEAWQAEVRAWQEQTRQIAR